MKKITLENIATEILNADLNQVACQFKIARLLTVIRDHKLYAEQYDNMGMCMQCEFEFHPSTGNAYMKMYHHYLRLKYNESEFTHLMQQFGWRKLAGAIKGSSRKIGYRKIKEIIDQQESAHRGRQFHIEVPEKDAARLCSVLSRFGMEEKEGGNRINTSTSMIGLLDDYERLDKARPGRDKKLQEAS